MKKFLLIVFVGLFVSLLAESQKAPIRFGKVSMEELEMKSYNKDTTAPAVVLCDYGFFDVGNVDFKRIVRIKILKKEGYEWGNYAFQSDYKSSLRGITTNLVDGEMVQEKLKNESIYSTRIINDVYILRAAMPDVRVGSVIDMEFSYFGVPSEWKFQEDIPVIYSEIYIQEIPNVTFRKNFFGFEKLDYSPPSQWIARNVPAFKTEPMLLSKENYVTKLKFDLVSVGFSMINSSWIKVNDLLLESSYFGMPGTITSFLNETAKELKDKYSDREALLKAAYHHIRERINWNDIVQLTSSDGNLASVYKLRTGNSAEINLLLYQLLKKLDFDVKLVVLSTRENGSLSIYFPSIRQLNYTILQVSSGDKTYILDACEKYMPFNMIPVRCINQQGRVVIKDIDSWIQLTATKKDKDLTIYDMSIEPDNSLKGTISYMRSDYSAFDFRTKYHKFNSQEEYIDKLMEDQSGLTIEAVKFTNLDSVDFPITEVQNAVITNKVNLVDQNLYLIPTLLNQMKENPFKQETRRFPVEYGVPMDKTVILNLSIPDGYEPFSYPLPANIKLPGNAGGFLYDVAKEGNNLKVTSKININKLTFLPDEYPVLREFYNQIIKKQAEPVILKKQ